MRSSASLTASASVFLSLVSFRAFAAEPEQLEQLEPEGGAWLAEYNGTFGPDESSHGGEVLYGIDNRIAVGAEAEFESEGGAPSFDEAEGFILLTFDRAEGGRAGFGLKLGGGVNRDGRISEVEARLITEQRSGGIWSQGNLILRHVRGAAERSPEPNEEPEGKGTLIAFAASVQKEVGDELWLGLEASGEPAHLSGFDPADGEGFDASLFLGPSLTAEFETGGDGEVEVGIAMLFGLIGEDTPAALRIFVQTEF
ncbi:hypothetical protein B5C34_12600 [Pacificimonas flava]|uniref:Uncharacterized protein n=2 Tax=Pacificimonas TaxID=1960290 RepID=A0A219B7Q5_9SPHN|nr:MULTISPECIES: hypothetical protein [Pacificimonas]MBZ6378494.1 hypothetical protein [Pacificimonas aurantium]OWV34214.1 hypothetical protein B5C34_12600 [Pacificimonas flava]